MSSNHWQLDLISGGRPLFFRYSPNASFLYSEDGRYLIALLQYQVRVYFIATRQCIRSIDVDLSEAVDVSLDNENTSCILVFKHNWEVIMINWKEKGNRNVVNTRKIECELPLLAILSVYEGHFYAVCGKREKGILVSPHNRYVVDVRRDSSKHFVLMEVERVTHFGFSSNSKKIVFLNDKHEVRLVSVEWNQNGVLQTDNGDPKENGATSAINLEVENIPFTYKSPVTSIAISNDSIVAIGTLGGTIQMLYGGLISEKPQRLLKWHIDQVNSLCFNEDSTYLLSGGLENVLVLWQLETDNTQFLPRLSGNIDKISIDLNKNDFYNLMLKVGSYETDSSHAENTYELLALSAVDMVSRLSIDSIHPKISSNPNKGLLKIKKRLARSGSELQDLKVKNDLSCVFEANPKTKSLYFPYNSFFQAYDLFRNEQNFVQSAAPVFPVGKVKSETRLLDPDITLLGFTSCGEWMCTFDTITKSDVDNLLSKNDVQYSLKFWKLTESVSQSDGTYSGKNAQWELTTKIVDPHGRSNPVVALCAAPSSYNNGLAFLTADDKGGLRLWRPRIPREIYQSPKIQSGKSQQAWTLRKMKSGGASASDAVDISWSEDGSLIFMAHELFILTINSQTFEEIPNNVFKIPSLSGSRIRSLSMIGHYLIILSKTRLVSFNLLTAKTTDLQVSVPTTSGSKNLLAVDPLRQLLVLAVNYYVKEEQDVKINSKIFGFTPNKLEPIFVLTHSQGISSIRNLQSTFIFVDLDSRIGIISNDNIDIARNYDQEDIAAGINKVLLSAQATADVISQKEIRFDDKNSGHRDLIDFNKNNYPRAYDLNKFLAELGNIDGIQIDALFDQIVKVVK